VELPYDLWHLAFVYMVTHGAPPNFDVLSEVRLAIEPQRADMILLRRKDAERLDEQATVLRRLWPSLGKVTVLEYKSPTNYAFKPGDLLRLCVYGMLYDMSHLDELSTRSDLTLVLVVASVTPTLRTEIDRMGAKLVSGEGGYARIEGLVYICIVAIIDDVCEAERDEYLQLFSHHPVMTGKTAEWVKQWMREAKMKGTNIEDYAGYEEWFQKQVEATLEAMPVEKRLAGLDPQQRLAGLDPQQLVINLPFEVLRGLSEEYIRSLPPEVQQTVRRRLQDKAH
jgi:hypothetical protein